MTLDDITSLLPKSARDSEEEDSRPSLIRSCTASREALLQDFREFDKDDSGEITLNEFIAVMQRDCPGHGDFAEQEAALVEMFQTFDVDGDGTVCYKECAKSFDPGLTLHTVVK